MNAAEVSQLTTEIVRQVEKAIVGKTETIEQAILVLLCNGHILLEDILA